MDQKRLRRIWIISAISIFSFSNYIPSDIFINYDSDFYAIIDVKIIRTERNNEQMIKQFLINIVICCTIFIISSCNNPLSSCGNTISTGNYTGTFKVTFKKFKNSLPLKQSGTISIQFEDSTYTYSAIVKYSSDTTASDSLGDHGKYFSKKGEISMQDISWYIMNPYRMNSLYFENTFQISYNGIEIQIYQDTSFARWQLDLILEQ